MDNEVLLAVVLGLAGYNTGYMFLMFNTQDKLIHKLDSYIEGELEKARAALKSHHRGLTILHDSVFNLLGCLLDVAEHTGAPIEVELDGVSVTTPQELAELLVSKMGENITEVFADDIVEQFSKLLNDVATEMEASNDDDTN